MTNNETFDLTEYLSSGVERIVTDSIRASSHSLRAKLFMIKFAMVSRKAAKRRAASEKKSLHVPPFLIASITSSCNLHCAGCYSRCNNATVDTAPVCQLSSDEWLKIFKEAADIGTSYIILAGGEPMLRRDVIEAAGSVQKIIFPIFTNGTYMDEAYYKLLDKRRNLLPVLSIEGGREETDTRRGKGIYDTLMTTMDNLNKHGILFGASITVTTENAQEVVSDEFVNSLADKGCKVVVYVEFVPVTEDSKHLAPGEKERTILQEGILCLRQNITDMVFLAFPGDEKETGGCVAAGRGFFHINSHGGAEPCPFSPYSDINVKDTGLRGALNSPLFIALQQGGLLDDDHAGGCVLYEKRDQVEAILNAEKTNK